MTSLRKFITTAMVVSAAICQTNAQNDTVHDAVNEQVLDNLEYIIEGKLETVGDETDFSEEISELLVEGKSQSNINSVSAQIAAIKLQLTDYQYYQLQKYIYTYGELVSLYELYAIEGFDKKTVERIIPIIKANPTKRRKPFAHFFRNGRHELLLRYGQILEKQEGYAKTETDGYLGSPARLAFKYTFRSNDIFTFGISGEKDAGEQFFRGAEKQGFDFYSFHLEFKNLGLLRKVVIGDYKLNFGQGVILGSGLTGTKGGGAVSCRKFTTGIRAVTPINEGEFLRGAAIEVGNASYNGTIFYSHTFYDGKTTPSESNEDELIFEGSLNNTGYHRTENEIEKKNALMKRLYGFHVQINRRIFRLGVQGIRSEFSHEILPNEKTYQKYKFSGKGSSNLSIDYQLILKKHLLYGEIGTDKNFRIGLLQGATFNFDPCVKMSAIFRYYDKKFTALNSNAFGENSPNQNETGLYVVTDIILGRKAEISVSGDFYRHNWLQYGIDAPSKNCDFICQAKISPAKHLKIGLRYDYRHKAYNTSGEHLNEIGIRHRHRVKAALTYTPYNFLKFKTETGFIANRYETAKKTKSGVLFLQDIDLNLEKAGLSIKARLAYFDTDSYDERIYAYESDLLYSFTITPHFDTGIRGFLMIKYGYKWFDIWVRVARTFYTNKESVGSGLEKIDAPHKTELKAQLVIKM
ncbi:MAG: hypothetical protein J6W84_06920 [Bacteroidales bacterium]|nr:hypothetical protein [Bacteroidales bacterium]